MPVEFIVYRYDLSGEPQPIGKGKLPDAPSHVNIKRPKGRIDFEGKDHPVVQVSLSGYKTAGGELVPNIPALFEFPVIIGNLEVYPIIKVYAISMLFKAPK